MISQTQSHSFQKADGAVCIHVRIILVLVIKTK
jgi:hypothetical protein